MSVLLGKLVAKTSTNYTGANDTRLQNAVMRRLDKIDKAFVFQNIGKTISVFYKKSLLSKGILGRLANYGKGEDLQAEFGLTKDHSIAADNAINEILKNSISPINGITINKQYKTGKDRHGTVSINARFLDKKIYEPLLRADRMLQTMSSVYRRARTKLGRFSGGKKETSSLIRWIEMVLNPRISVSTLISDIDRYAIVYDLDARAAAKSRSGRALMVDITKPKPRKKKNRELVNSKAYRVPYILTPRTKGSNNLIEDISNETGFLKEVRKVLRSAMLQTLRIERK